MQVLESLRNIVVPSTPSWFLPGKIAPVKNRLHVVHAHSWQEDRDGNIIWVEDGWQHNILHSQGEQYILSRAFNTAYAGGAGGWDPAGWTTANAMWLGLDNRATPAEGDTLASLSGEPSGFNYGRIQVDINDGDFTISDSGSGYYQASTGTLQFQAVGGAWTQVSQRFLCTDSTATASAAGDLLIATVALSSARTLQDGDTLNTNLILGLSES